MSIILNDTASGATWHEAPELGTFLAITPHNWRVACAMRIWSFYHPLHALPPSVAVLSHHVPINYKDTKPWRSSFLKHFTCKGILAAGVYLSEAPSPRYTLYKYIPLSPVLTHTEKGGREGRSTSEKVRGALVHKRGRKYQHDVLYLQSINSIKHRWHLGFGVFIVIWFMSPTFATLLDKTLAVSSLQCLAFLLRNLAATGERLGFNLEPGWTAHSVGSRLRRLRSRRWRLPVSWQNNSNPLRDNRNRFVCEINRIFHHRMLTPMPHPPFFDAGKAGRNHLNEKITHLLPTAKPYQI
jgi:hypothetical protein